MAGFIAELRRRNVVRVGVLYIVAGWLILQVGDVLIEPLGLPDWSQRMVLFVLILGFPLTLVFAWVFELTPDGLKRESEVDRGDSIAPLTGRRVNAAIAVLTVLAIAVVVGDRLVPEARETPAHEDSRVSIAVLPFVNMSSDPEQEYLSDGLTEELLNLLSRITDLRVIARTSSFYFKGKDVLIADIGRQLDVSHVLEGSVRTSGERIRVTAQLIATADSSHLWSETYDSDFGDVFAVQDEVAAAVVDVLHLKLLGRPLESTRVDQEAMQLYLQGRYYWNRRGPGDVERARDYYQRAVEADPSIAGAWAGLSGVDFMQGRFDGARAAAERAVALDPDLPEAMVRMANVHAASGDWEASRAGFRRALEYGPDSTLALMANAKIKQQAGRTREAIALYRRAARADPLSAIVQNNMSHYLLFGGEYEAAEAAARRVDELNPDNGERGYVPGLSRLLQGRPEDALELVAQTPDDASRRVVLAAAYYDLGRIEESDAALAVLAEDPAEDVRALAVRAWRGEADSVFARIEEWREAYGERSALQQLVHNPMFVRLEGDPRWPALLAELRGP